VSRVIEAGSGVMFVMKLRLDMVAIGADRAVESSQRTAHTYERGPRILKRQNTCWHDGVAEV